jgi:hypothetical protein
LPNKAIAKWPRLPLPIVPKLTFFLALAAATTSANVLYSEPTCVANTIGDVPTKTMGIRSFLLSNGMLGVRLGLTPNVSNTTANV